MLFSWMIHPVMWHMTRSMRKVTPLGSWAKFDSLWAQFDAGQYQGGGEGTKSLSQEVSQIACFKSLAINVNRNEQVFIQIAALKWGFKW